MIFFRIHDHTAWWLPLQLFRTYSQLPHWNRMVINLSVINIWAIILTTLKDGQPVNKFQWHHLSTMASQITSHLITGPLWEESIGHTGFLAQRDSNAELISSSWHHHDSHLSISLINWVRLLHKKILEWNIILTISICWKFTQNWLFICLWHSVSSRTVGIKKRWQKWLTEGF